MRIDKFLSQMKFCTRNEVKKFLKIHEVKIDDLIITSQQTHVDPLAQKIYVDGKLIYYEDPIHLMLNKPKGYISALKDKLYPSVINLISAPYDRFDFKIVGRLDVDTEGLLILTTDGQFLHEITHPNYHLPKTYEVILDKPLEDAKSLLEGVMIEDGHKNLYLARALNIECDKEKAWITIDEGKFHQVKRMFKEIGYHVLYLKRIQIGNLKLKDLKIGELRQINRSDIYD